MKITEPVRQHLLKVLHQKGISQSQFAKAVGHHKTWASRLLRAGPGALKTLEEEDKDAIEEHLGIMLETMVDRRDRIPQLALDVAEALQRRQDLAPVIASILELAEPRTIYAVPHFTNKTLVKLGAEATRIVHEWEEHDDPHYNKIGLEVLMVVRDLIERELRK